MIVGDGIDYVKRAPDASFDVIIVDSTDPIGVGEVLFTDEFYRNCARILTARGLVVNQCGVPLMQADELRDTSVRRRKFFPHVTAYVAAVPDLCRRVHDPRLGRQGRVADRRPRSRSIRARAQAAGILGNDAVLDAGDPRRRIQPAALYRASPARSLTPAARCARVPG